MSTLTAPDRPARSSVARRSVSQGSGSAVAATGMPASIGPSVACEMAISGVAPPASGDGDQGDRSGRPKLTLVSARPSRAVYWRRRGLVALGLLLAALVLALVVGQVVASADLESRVDGHVVVEPGQTLWQIAATTAPEGVDAREQLAAIEDLNDLRAADLRPWKVVLLPAR